MVWNHASPACMPSPRAVRRVHRACDGAEGGAVQGAAAAGRRERGRGAGHGQPNQEQGCASLRFHAPQCAVCSRPACPTRPTAPHPPPAARRPRRTR
jgi:hypothetical protein